jgi:hypothetical protein
MRYLLLSLFALAVPAISARSDQPRVIFEDRFEGKLADGWTWLREDKHGWRLKDGGLEIRVQPGKAATVRNALVRDLPEHRPGTWSYEVSVTNLTEPIQQYEQAGLTWYHDGKPAFKLVKELVDGKVVIVPGKIPFVGKTVQLRVLVRDNQYTAQYRPEDGGEWHTAATGKLPAPGKGKDQISLQCYDGPPAAEHWMRFRNFRIVQLPETAAAEKK